MEKKTTNTWGSVGEKIANEAPYDDSEAVSKLPKNLQKSHHNSIPQPKEKHETQQHIEDQFDDTIDEKINREEKVDPTAVSYVKKAHPPEPKPEIIDQEEGPAFGGLPGVTQGEKAWKGISQEIRTEAAFEGPYDDEGDRENVEKRLKSTHNNHPAPKSPKQKPEKEFVDEFDDTMQEKINKPFDQGEGVSYVTKSKPAEPKEIIVDQEEGPAFGGLPGKTESQKIWNGISNELRINSKFEGEYDDGGNIDKNLRSTHAQHKPNKDPKQKPDPQIEDEFDDTMQEKINKPFDQGEGVSYVTKTKPVEPKEIIIDQEEGPAFGGLPGKTEPQKIWDNISNELRIKTKFEGEYDDSQDVENADKHLRSSHAHKPHNVTPKQKPEREIEDEFDDDINKKINEEPKQGEGVSSVVKTKPVEPKPIVMDSDEKPQYGGLSPRKESKAWHDATQQARIDAQFEGPYDDSQDVENLPKNLRKTHHEPPRHEKAAKAEKQARDDFYNAIEVASTSNSIPDSMYDLPISTLSHKTKKTKKRADPEVEITSIKERAIEIDETFEEVNDEVAPINEDGDVLKLNLKSTTPKSFEEVFKLYASNYPTLKYHYAKNALLFYNENNLTAIPYVSFMNASQVDAPSPIVYISSNESACSALLKDGSLLVMWVEDSGITIAKIIKRQSNSKANCVAICGTPFTICVGCADGVEIFNGTSWTKKNISGDVRSIVIADGEIVALQDGGTVTAINMSNHEAKEVCGNISRLELVYHHYLAFGKNFIVNKEGVGIPINNASFCCGHLVKIENGFIYEIDEHSKVYSKAAMPFTDYDYLFISLDVIVVIKDKEIISIQNFEFLRDPPLTPKQRLLTAALKGVAQALLD